MAPLNSHFDGARQRVTNRRFSVKYTRPYTRNSTVGHKFFVTGGVKREMDIADISMARTRYFRNAFLPFLYRAPRPPRTRPFARDLSVAINEKKSGREQREIEIERKKERTKRFYLFKSSSPKDCARACSMESKRNRNRSTWPAGRPTGPITVCRSITRR